MDGLVAGPWNRYVAGLSPSAPSDRTLRSGIDVLTTRLGRQFLAGGAALAALLAGCGRPTAEAPAGSGAPGFPRTLEGKEGSTTIPAEPRRVVAVGFQRDADTVLALGAAPIAISKDTRFSRSGIVPWVEAVLTEPRPQLLNTVAGMPFEEIAALRPDLILATDDYDLAANWARLSAIAPTLSYLQGPAVDTWQQRNLHIGRALGREKQAQQAIADLEARVLEADVVLMSYVGDDSRALLESNPVFQQLNAVRNGNYIATERPVSAALGFPSVLSIPYGLERTVAAIARVLA